MTVATTAAKLRRQFIDWQAPPLPATAEWLAEQFATDDLLDLSGFVLVVPTTRCGRRMTELLMDESARRGLLFTPPDVTTIGNVPEMLYRPAKPLASELVQSLAWVEALRESPRDELQNFTRVVPAPDDFNGWRSLAGILASWHEELAAHALSFPDVLKAGERLDIFQEHERWEALGAVQRRYLDVLGRTGMWDRQSARLVAIEQRECRIDRQLILVGMVDLNPVVRDMLQQVAGQVTAVVFANPDQPEWFDESGCLDFERWQDAVLSIADDQIQVADQPGDPARMVARSLAELNGEYATDDVMVSVPDPRLVSHIRRALAEHGIASCDCAGSSISNTRPFVLLDLISRWLSSESFESFATLVRHPDMYDWIFSRTHRDDWLAELDRYQNNRLPWDFPPRAGAADFEGTDRRGKSMFANLERAFSEMCELIQPLSPPASGDREILKSLKYWAGAWRKVLVAVYRDTVLNPSNAEERRNVRACQEIARGLVELEQAHEVLTHEVTCIAAIDWALSLCGSDFVADPFVANSISLVGWLDTAWEDTPVAIITAVNDGWIPSTESSSLFLPNTIRGALGLLDNHRRFARDAYALSLILKSRQHVQLIVGRRDEDGEPLLPSRLLMTGDSDLVARRALQLFQEGESIPAISAASSAMRPAKQLLGIPQPPADLPEINGMRVTDFKGYIQCPYRYYLANVLGLEHLADSRDELDAAQFGTLLHDVVKEFGASELRDSVKPQWIENHVLDCLTRLAVTRFGRNPLPSVAVQVEQARMRLKAFAQWQASHRRGGYEIFAVERERTRHTIDLDGRPFELRGQIDRIDVNHQSRRIAVLDYKTGDAGEGPREAHQDKEGNWTNLQLPLYRLLLKEFSGLPVDYTVEFGYVLLARDIGAEVLAMADWSDEELAGAFQLAEEVMRKVRAGVFWPPNDTNVPVWQSGLTAICQTEVFERWSPEGPVAGTTGPLLRPHFRQENGDEQRKEKSWHK